ncbi:hypothetical protein N7520_000409 [Penicillium odoratum]|uniref:uncharacterized protein n=1 Tax=Penicillium odoratum TaxID=1167516 RepID=UPI0025469EEF|nr:uncharacterized protein N7520_000409 [Penicillium odoratum]KAJ5777163.1 hypothetical protein N7520_000409 [Penicillium odoratum]
MAEPPPESSHPPPGTPLIDSTRSYGDSMEDPDPQATRKRPRLDSGNRVGESLSIDSCATPPAALASEMDVTPDSARPSKVTINVKSPTTDMTSEPIESAPTEPQTFTPATTPQPATTENTDATPDVILIASSPSQSPEIEVAELEDMDQDPNTSHWRPIDEALRGHAASDIVEDEPLALIDTFPKLYEDQVARDNLQRIIMIMEKQEVRETDILTVVKAWFEQAANNLDCLLLSSVIDDIDFWDLVPKLMETMLRRNVILPMDAGHGVLTTLEEFLVDYVRITHHLLHMDCMNLRHELDEPEMQDSVSRAWLNNLAWLLQYSTIPFFRATENVYGTEVIDVVARVRAKTVALGVFQELVDFASLIAENAAKKSHWVNALVPFFHVANSAIDSSVERRQIVTGELTVDSPFNTPHLKLLYDTVRLIDEKFQESISKKSSWLTSELAEQLLRQTQRCLNLLYARDNEFVTQMSSDLSIELSDDIDVRDQLLILVWGWKFRILKKYIMEGRMELRAHGVETMQSDLVSIWRQHLSADPSGLEIPFVKYLVRFILDNKIVDYLVGVDSHPQLISRCSNIVGFLIVTSTYNKSVTDMIWATVTDSQDSRIVSEVLAMLVKTFWMHATTAPDVIYICAKVLDLPLDRFDGRMLEFCDSMLSRISERPLDHDAGEYVDAIPLRLCVRLIRESTAAEDMSVEQKKLMQTKGAKYLERFIEAGISVNDRMDMYERCIQDIAEMNQFTAGSIQVLCALVPMNDSQEMRKLAEEFDLTRLVINDLLHTVKDDQADFANASSHYDLESRIEILYRLVDMAPDTVTPELGSAFWNEILLSNKLGHDGHKAAWKMMSALSGSSKSNPFLERCIHEYLPGLSPKDFTLEVLSFAKQSISYEVRFNPPPPAGDDEVITVPGMDRIWNFILTALPGTIETEATEFAIEVYLDHRIIRNSPRGAIEATHISVVNRCIDQLKSTAATLNTPESTVRDDTSMDSVTLSGELDADELKFRRSLIFLRQFLYGLRTRPIYSPPRGSPPSLPERPLKGNPIDISWQSFNGSAGSPINTLRIGDLSTAAELMERLVQLTGFSKLLAIWGGQRFDILTDPDILVKDMKRHPGLLILRKAPDAQEVCHDSKNQSLTTVDSEVLKHFDEIYELLSLKDDLAREIFDFLIVFPPQQRVLALVSAEDSDEKTLFPLRTPFVAFYSFNALLTCLRAEEIQVTPKQSFVSHSIAILVKFLMSHELSESIKLDRLRFALATKAIECLLSALAVYRPDNDASALISDPAPFVRRLLGLIETARSLPETPMAAAGVHKLICDCFAFIIEGSIRDHKFWETVKQFARFDQLMLDLLLKECRQTIRNDVSERIKMICRPKLLKQSGKITGDGLQTQNPAESPTRIDMLATIWDALVGIIPQTPDYAGQSAEFFKVVLWVFRSVAEKSPQDVILSHYLREWTGVMFRHQPEEFVGREIVDELILGFALLLESCLELAEYAMVELDTSDLPEKILNTYLFPDLSDIVDSPITPRIPVMHTLTRQKLYNVINLLCNRTDENLHRTMRELEDVVPRDVSYGPNSNYERSKMIRAPEGYAGLKNLSNTCYLNSLMTQLFMNVEFRDFMLRLQVVDGDSSQVLLEETQKLFAWMQNTWTKSFDPQAFVESIRTYDNEAIDVTVQMDVDEFYNLLFDRWEAQIVDSKCKKKFRSFYGGQLVQQIKSKECSHISERLEPFSAIQCDIKGKANLEESLQAYVEGEIMQGDNKYSCTACGRHVDAVKRACLKDVPDNLIFHLKRFDFDMVSMTRSKINDEFQFPDRIDMTPYNVEYLSDPEMLAEPDVFELVGVLVHTGTAESGHYYSYTRERPSAGSASWVEFNDSDVSRFDPSTIADQCFGGHGETMHSMGGVHISKVWNAYMLFYQRVSMMDKSKEFYQPLKQNCPVRVPVPIEFANHIAMENELFIRTYCLLDPSYAYFVHRLLETMRETNLDYAHRSELEVLAMEVGLDTFEQLILRTKEYLGAESMVTELYQLLRRNPRAALQTLKWTCSRNTSLRNIILRSANGEIRQKGIMLLMGALQRLHLMDPELDESERIPMKSRAQPLIERIVDMLQSLWPTLQGVPRVWEDYFDCFIKLAECGLDVMGILFDKRIFIRCLEIIWFDQDDRMKLERFYPNYSRMLEKGRRFMYSNMLMLCALFFRSMDFALRAVPDNEIRKASPDGKFPVSYTESRYIWQVDDDGNAGFLRQLLQHENFGLQDSTVDIFRSFVVAEPEAGFMDRIIKSLEIGLRLSPAELCGPFLVAAIVFCKHAPEVGDVTGMIDFVAKGVTTINNSGGIDHLDFFTQLSNQDAVNERLSLGPEWFSGIVQQRIPDFVPTLLVDPERVVRQQTIELTNRLLFSLDSAENMTQEPRSPHIEIGRQLGKACVQKINTLFLAGQIASVESRMIYNITSTVTRCLENYFDPNDEDDQLIIQQANETLNLLEQITVDVPDDFVSESEMASPEEWEATSALASDSEMGLAGSP